jgi:putative transposase
VFSPCIKYHFRITQPTIRVDQGSEFISRDLDLWAYQNDVTLDFSRPRKPTDNAFIESLRKKAARRRPLMLFRDGLKPYDE